MLKKRFKTIISLVDKDASVIEIGTDHAYIPILLYKNNITTKIVATDIRKEICEKARENINKNDINNIKVIESDGFKNIKDKYDIAIISGMGTSTILNILNTNKLPDTLIISSQNDYEHLRKELNLKGYKIEQEIVIYEKRFYPIIKYITGKEKLTKNELLFGKSNNIIYYKYLINKYDKLFEKSSNKKYIEYKNELIKIIEKI